VELRHRRCLSRVHAVTVKVRSSAVSRRGI
jgi:hypothetical protein